MVNLGLGHVDIFCVVSAVRQWGSHSPFWSGTANALWELDNGRAALPSLHAVVLQRAIYSRFH